MDRSEFLIALWKKAIQPFLLLLAIVLCIAFLVNASEPESAEQFTILLLLGFGTLFLIASLARILFHKITKKAYSLFSPMTKIWLKIIGKVLDYLSPIVLGMSIYHLWIRDWGAAAIILGVILVPKISQLIQDATEPSIESDRSA